MMTKEQFLQFKSDLKNDIEINKLLRKYDRKWSNLGFASEEEYNKAREIDKAKAIEIFGKVTKHENGSMFISSCFMETHLAYYCAKHRLDEEGIKKYVDSEFNKMRVHNRVAWPHYNRSDRLVTYVKDILSRYEALVCTN